MVTLRLLTLAATLVAALALLLPLAASARTILYFDLLPAGAKVGFLRAITGSQQAGYVVLTNNNQNHAGIWFGTPSSFADLNPVGVTHSRVWAASDNQQAGETQIGFGDVHATIWSGSSASFVDLHPAGYVNSIVYATTINQQAGYATIGGATHAGIWSNSAASFVDLNQSGAAFSWAWATTGGQQAGFANLGAGDRAGIWFGSNTSFVNLHPAGATWSEAKATTGSQQAGYATFGGSDHAGLWSGTAASFVDLHTILGSAFLRSYANAIWTNSSSIFVAGYATDFDNYDHPILWVVLPFTSTCVAGTNSGIPGGSGNYTNLPSAASLSGSNVAFFGAGAGGQQGIYARSSGVLARVADTNTAIPGGSGNFITFSPPSPITPPNPIISGDNVAFFGSGSGNQQGVYAKISGSLTKVADTNTAIPGGIGNFTTFFPPNPILPPSAALAPENRRSAWVMDDGTQPRSAGS
jgi:hypothetical protein